VKGKEWADVKPRFVQFVSVFKVKVLGMRGYLKCSLDDAETMDPDDGYGFCSVEVGLHRVQQR
jgi:hypothetical protein